MQKRSSLFSAKKALHRKTTFSQSSTISSTPLKCKNVLQKNGDFLFFNQE